MANVCPPAQIWSGRRIAVGWFTWFGRPDTEVWDFISGWIRPAKRDVLRTEVPELNGRHRQDMCTLEITLFAAIRCFTSGTVSPTKNR